VRLLVAQRTLTTPAAAAAAAAAGPGEGVGTDAPALAAVWEARNCASDAPAAFCRWLTTAAPAAFFRRLATAAPVAATAGPPSAAVSLTAGTDAAVAKPNNLLLLFGPLYDHVASLIGTPAGAALYPGDMCAVLEAAVVTSWLLVPSRAVPAAGAPAPSPPPTAARSLVLVGLLTPAVAALSGAVSSLPTPQALLSLSPPDRDGLGASLLVVDVGAHVAAASHPAPGIGSTAGGALGVAATLLSALASLPVGDSLLALQTVRKVSYLLNEDVKGASASSVGGQSGGERAVGAAADALARLSVGDVGIQIPRGADRDWTKAVRHSVVAF